MGTVQGCGLGSDWCLRGVVEGMSRGKSQVLWDGLVDGHFETSGMQSSG